MKAGWQKITLGYACKFIDYRGKTPEKISSGLRLITAKNVKMGFIQEEPLEYVSPSVYSSWMIRGIPRKGDVLFTTEAPLANIAQLDTDEKVVFAQRIIILQPLEDGLNSTFLKYMLLSDSVQEKIREKATGATVLGIKASLLKNIEITFPPIQEQQRIVAILDQAFEGIAKARANAEQNLQNARALFESHLQSVFTQRGEGLEEKAFDEVLEIKNGKDQKPVEKAGGKYPIYGSAGNVMGWTDSYICDEQTTIIGRKGTINRPIFIETKFWNVDTAFGLAAKPNLNAKFLYFFCLSYDFSLHNRGTTIPSLVKTDLLNIKISVPSLSVQELLVKKFTVLHNETKRLEANYQRKIACLDELKKSLLQQAFAGEL